jgi:hypothetical protein
MYFQNFNHEEISDNILNTKDLAILDDHCIICLENGNIIKLQENTRYYCVCKCNYYIHTTCLEDWLKINRTCLLCKENIIELHNIENNFEIVFTYCHYNANRYFIIRESLLYIIILTKKTIRFFFFCISVTVISIFLILLSYFFDILVFYKQLQPL